MFLRCIVKAFSCKVKKYTSRHYLSYLACLMAAALYLFTLPLWAITKQNNHTLNDTALHAFIQHMVTKYHFQKNDLETLFQQVTFQSSALASIKKPAESLTWTRYSQFFLTKERINAGIQFFDAHNKAFCNVQQKTGVPASIILAILGVETFYGKVQGNYRVIDVLTTLAFADSGRQSFFKSELENYLLLTRDMNLDPLSIQGSYAGAIGQAQFMPSSYRRYAISYKQKKTVDLRHNSNDVILSIANYLTAHGWIAHAPIVLPAYVRGSRYTQLQSNQLNFKHNLADLANFGVFPLHKNNKLAQTKVNFMQLSDQTTRQQYWIGLHNFYVLSRYNPRINYTMTVYLLSQALAPTVAKRCPY